MLGFNSVFGRHDLFLFSAYGRIRDFLMWMAQILPNLNAPHLHLWLALGVGVAIGFVALFLGQRALHRPIVKSAENGDKAVLAPAPEDYDPFVQGSQGEKRTSCRRRGKYLEIELTTDPGHGENIRGWVLDRSLGGLRLSVDQDWPAEAILAVRVLEKADSMPWLEVRVKYCKKASHGWELGCQFVKQPSWNLLLMFG